MREQRDGFGTYDLARQGDRDRRGTGYGRRSAYAARGVLRIYGFVRGEQRLPDRQRSFRTGKRHGRCGSGGQFRFPLEYGGQRTPTAQWTVTGSGAVILSSGGEGPYITAVTCGRIVDPGIKDANNMGAAMAPAAFDTLLAHFTDLKITPSEYDLIVTGDLGTIGSSVLVDMFADEGIPFGDNYSDCGLMIYSRSDQDVHAGASGCGCSASVLTGHLLNGMRMGKWRKILFAATGALMSPTATQQGESIPGVCCAVSISKDVSPSG